MFGPSNFVVNKTLTHEILNILGSYLNVTCSAFCLCILFVCYNLASLLKLDQLKNLLFYGTLLKKKSPQTSSSIENHRLKIACHFWQYWNFSKPNSNLALSFLLWTRLAFKCVQFYLIKALETRYLFFERLPLNFKHHLQAHKISPSCFTQFCFEPTNNLTFTQF